MNKFEQLIEYIINEEEDKAKALFHEIVIEKSRNIYESMMDDENEVGGNQVQKLMKDVSVDEEGMHEDNEVEYVGDEDSMSDADDEIDFGGDAAGDMELGGDDEEFDTDEVGVGDEDAAGELEDRVMDLESALDELKAEFDALMGSVDSDNDGDHDMDDHAAEVDDDDDEENSDDEPKESLVREYVEKVSVPATKQEGGPVGSSNTNPASVNAKSVVAGKNDMGGTTSNIARGGAESAPDGTAPTKKPSNQYTKGQGHLPHAEKYENVPGARAGQAFGKASKLSSSQGVPVGAKNTMGSSVNNKSVIESRGRSK
ncbi:MAG: hypothetical protein N2235_16605 [Fischerella sp.]|nr:hypothetical protein [Fischerella sp.]